MIKDVFFRMSRGSKSDRRYGNFEYGDVYSYDKDSGGRGEYIGRLIVNQDEQRFYIKEDGKAARGITYERVNNLLANDLIDFYHEDSRDYLINYMMRLMRYKDEEKKHRREQYRSQQAMARMEKVNKVEVKTRSAVRLSRLFWLIGCMMILVFGFLLIMPEDEPAPAKASIEGVGMEYPVDGSLLNDATYMTAFGNGSSLYGLVLDNKIIESGTQNSNESTIQENVLVNAGVSSRYPIHLRPLYYDASTFYQSQIRMNDASGGSNGILLQNPNGYALGCASNELVLLGGSGMASVILSSPDVFSATSASETAQEIEQRQQREEQETRRGSSSSSEGDGKKIDTEASSMPEGWVGYDDADIDATKVAGSYWYTRQSSNKKEDLKRRIVVMDISPVLNQGESGVRSMDLIQMNYQDVDSSFYAPVISASPSSNGSTYWIGYMQQSPNGTVDFHIRKYEDAEDVLLESYDNTLSTRDLTNTDYPITNYKLSGDRLFFEQSGGIWCIDLSKIKITIDGNKRTVEKENPIKICDSSEIKPSISRDEQFIASETSSTTVPVSHYQIVTMTTMGGTIEYGIAFIEADTGNLVFQPCNGSSSTTVDNNSNNGNSNQAIDNESAGSDSLKTPKAGLNVNVSQGGGTDNITLNRILIRPGNSDYQIVCFCVRGEQFYWIEESNSDDSRKVMVSPIYYKNDASQLNSSSSNADIVDSSQNQSQSGSNEIRGISPETPSNDEDTIIESSSSDTGDSSAMPDNENGSQSTSIETNSNDENENAPTSNSNSNAIGTPFQPVE